MTTPPVDRKPFQRPAEGKKIDLMFQGRVDGSVEAFEVNGMLVIPAEDGVVYVTREQARDFFGLIDPARGHAIEDERDAVVVTFAKDWREWYEAYPRMSINAERGAVVMFDGRGGYDSEQKAAKSKLELRCTYVVERVTVHSSSSTVRLEGIEGEWNTVMFSQAPLSSSDAALRRARPFAVRGKTGAEGPCEHCDGQGRFGDGVAEGRWIECPFCLGGSRAPH